MLLSLVPQQVVWSVLNVIARDEKYVAQCAGKLGTLTHSSCCVLSSSSKAFENKSRMLG